MTQEKRTVIAAALSLLVFLLWYHFYGGKMVTHTAGSPPPLTEGSTPAGQTPTERAPTGQAPETTLIPEVLSEMESGDVTWGLSSRGGGFKGIALKRYPPVDLIVSPQDRGPTLGCDGCNFILPPEGQYGVEARRGREISYVAVSEGVKVTKTFTFPESGYPVDLKITVENLTRKELTGRLGLGWEGAQKATEKGGIFSFLKGPPDQRAFVYQLSGKLERSGQKNGVSESAGSISWAGIEDRYFLVGLVSRRLSSEGRVRMERRDGSVGLTLSSGGMMVPGGGSFEERFTLYLGPKDRELLSGVGVGLEKTVDYGFFSLFAIPILKLLLLFHSFVRNWGVAIILMTIVVKLLLNPLTLKSLRQMKEMQKLQPRLKELKEKYPNDKQRLNMETMQLFKSHKVNPLGGCLPMLVQMPIYIALYKVLYNSIELYRAPFFWFYKDLSGPDPFFIMPALLGVVMFWQQKMTPATTADPVQRQMMMIMPVMFTAFMLFLPLGLVLYIFVNTVMSVAQQYLFQKEIRLRDLLHRSS